MRLWPLCWWFLCWHRCLQVCMIFLFVCAIIISQWGTVADYANSEVAESVLGIDSDDEVAIIMLALTASVVSTLLALFAFQTYLVKRARQIEDKYSTCTMNPPIFAWRLESSYAAFLSHYKVRRFANSWWRFAASQLSSF
uniref:Uncharacterized protein n=1 Tax=Chrysotila carterae TaxID=13221 RepID=A0A7S4BYB5_CHRCT